MERSNDESGPASGATFDDEPGQGEPGAGVLFVSSPTARCGTTLVQRLLSSGPDALVFGEGVGAALLELSQALLWKERVLARAEEHRTDLGRLLRGEQFWCPHLLGDPDGFVALYRQALERFVRFHEDCARAHGRSRWGAKFPGVPVDDLDGLLRTLPGARVIYVIRGLVPAARSAKTRRFLAAPADFERFAALWRAGVAASEGLRRDPRVLVLAYEDLEQRGRERLAELAAFTGLRGLDPAVFSARVNTWPGPEEEGHSPDQYLAPAELSAEELAILESGPCSAPGPARGQRVIL